MKFHYCLFKILIKKRCGRRRTDAQREHNILPQAQFAGVYTELKRLHELRLNKTTNT